PLPSLLPYTTLFRSSVQVGTAGVGDEQGVSGHHEPRVVAARAVRDDVRVMRSGMSGGGDRLDLRVAELEHLAVRERMVLEVDSGDRKKHTSELQSR